MAILVQYLLDLGYHSYRNLKDVYVKFFTNTYIVIFIKEDGNINYCDSGVQLKDYIKFSYESQVIELIRTFYIYENHLSILKDLLEEDLKKYD